MILFSLANLITFSIDSLFNIEPEGFPGFIITKAFVLVPYYLAY